MTTTWNVEERHLEDLARTVEKMEAAGEKPYAVVFTERDSWAGDHTIKTLWKEEFGTLEDILHGFEADPHPTQSTFFETISGRHRDSGDSEPLPLTVENLSAYMTEEVFTQYLNERIELIPARQVLEELTEHFAQQTEQD